MAARFGNCKAMVEPKGGDPRPCTNNALEDDGWCGVHWVSEVERRRRAARQTAITADLNARIEKHIAMCNADPWWWLDQIKPSRDAERGLPAYHATKKAPPPKRKGPHRIEVPV